MAPEAIQPPIIICEGTYPEAFETVEQAQREVEAVDVRGGQFDFYDSEGRVLRGVVKSRPARGLMKILPPVELVVLEPVSEPGAATAHLRTVVSEFLVRHAPSPDKPLEAHSLKELIAALLRFQNQKQ